MLGIAMQLHGFDTTATESISEANYALTHYFTILGGVRQPTQRLEPLSQTALPYSTWTRKAAVGGGELCHIRFMKHVPKQKVLV